MINKAPFIPYARPEITPDEMTVRSKAYYDQMNERRSVRKFSSRPVPMEVMENIIMTAATAPSGAHKQPWTFALVTNTDLRKQIRAAAEEEEYESYHGRMSDEWLRDLAPMGTDWHKPFIEEAPYIIVIFKKIYELNDGEKHTNYYVNESVGIAVGMLISAIHNAGLVALTHTPSPMNFLAKILERPENERAFLLMPVGYAAADASVPNLERKTKADVIVKYE